MKYLLMIYQNPEAFESLTEAERNAVMAEVDTLFEELTRSGEWIGGEALAHPSTTRTVRVRDGVPVVTDGPFGEAKEQLAGYTLVECDTPQRALEIATRWPDARFGAMVVRPLMDHGGAEM